ncbi:unnamed protein product [marine sediment metagenome]|uniref:Uncharacterized protein n=1 Tax=marine sediment metagenome TaxID=412755 RepID=X1FYN6_9ZZZZ
MKCPKCGEELEAALNREQVKDTDYVEVELSCVNDHCYFFRIREDDLIEC